jgi:transposase
LKAAIQAPPRDGGIELPNWNWRAVRQFVRQRFGRVLCRSSCLNYLHRLGFVLKRPKKLLLKADEDKRRAFVAFYADLRAEAEASGAKVFFVDEAHFRADGDLRGKWVLRGEPALVGSTSPRLGEKATYYSAVCLETGEVEEMEVDGNCKAESSAAFLAQLRASHPGPLIVIWDNGPAHHGQAIRDYLATPGLRLRLVALPGYSPDFNADEAIWDWAREEVTANSCLGTRARRRWAASSAGWPGAPRRSSGAAGPSCRPRPMPSPL